VRPRAEAETAADANDRREDKFCSMKITQEIREFAAKQNQSADSFIAADEGGLSAEALAKAGKRYGRDEREIPGNRRRNIFLGRRVTGFGVIPQLTCRAESGVWKRRSVG